MFKIEVVAATPEEMAEKLAGLTEIFREGVRFVHNHDDALKRASGVNLDGSERRETVETEIEMTVELPKKRGPKPKPADVDADGSHRRPPKLAVVEAAAPEPEEAEAPTIDATREAMKGYCDAFWSANKKDPDAKAKAFRELLTAFECKKLSELPEDERAAMIKLAHEKAASVSA